jgi:hypothetical protein
VDTQGEIAAVQLSSFYPLSEHVPTYPPPLNKTESNVIKTKTLATLTRDKGQAMQTLQKVVKHSRRKWHVGPTAAYLRPGEE